MKCKCGHVRNAHNYEPGFYDDKGKYAECGVVGCYCERYDEQERS